jgi:DNA-binding CsgD family transcriptional regulator
MELAALGLAHSDGRIYVALVARPKATSAELAEVCGLSAVAAGRGLARLVESGLAGRISGTPVRYLAAAPDVVISDLIDRREAELSRARSFVHELMQTHREAARISHPDLAVEVLSNRDDISSLARRIGSDSRVQIRAFDRPPYVDRPGTNFQLQMEKLRGGVRHRVVYDRAALAWPGRIDRDILPSLKAGEQARVRPDLPLKLVISDDRIAMIPFSTAPRGEASAYVISQSSLLGALVALFEAEWERALPLAEVLADGAGSAAHGTPDDETRSLLALLASGLSDSAIARSLGWSGRTTQRRIQRLMRDLGASSRFQASVLATRRGWL